MTVEMPAVALLYIATYLSFTRLLRYPRNRYPPNPWNILATAALAIVTMVFVADSPEGIDVVVLLTSTSFVVVLFAVVAAPALAFRPASRITEFLARYGGNGGLLMLAPAIAVGTAFTNIKLVGLFTTAMAIEAVWWLRHLVANRRRPLYRLTGNDLSVLNRQAHGDLKGFAKKHGIRELLLSKSMVRWRGCNKRTLPCPLNLYVNRLGLNTAPCCREHMKELCHVVATWLREMEAVYWIEGKTLYGAVRGGGTLLPWEDDVDVSVLIEGDVTWPRLAKELAERGAREGYSVDAHEKYGYFTICYDRPARWPFHWQRNRLRGEIRLELTVYRRAISFGRAVVERCTRNDEMPVTESGWYGVPQKLVLPTATITSFGGDFSCPSRPQEYLRVLYGDFRKLEHSYFDSTAAKTGRRVGTKSRRKAAAEQIV